MDQPHEDRPPTSARKLSGEWWTRLDALFEEASALAESERDAFLGRTCDDAPSLRAEVLSLLHHADSGDALLNSAAVPAGSYDSISDASAGSLDALVGRTLGNYRIEARVGTGGMGVVYRASDTRLDRPVALKFIGPALSTDPMVRERFLVEARAAAGLDHPNLCTVHEVSETEDGALFISMAYYEGETLKERLARGPFPIGEAVEAVTQIARGVSAAHARGIVHRDIKPSNVLVTDEGVAKVLDFGVAKTGDSTLTGPGAAVGTTAYMSPEQFRGAAADFRSDVWSLGVVLYELLAGRRPFHGDTPAGTLHAVLYEDPVPIEALRPAVPTALAAVVRRALARDPGRRPQTADELIAALEAAMENSGRQGLPRGRRNRHRLGERRAAAIGMTALAATVIFLAASSIFARDSMSRGPSGLDPSPQAMTIAVLAFEDLSPGTDQTWFADGFSEEIREQLARIGGLQLIGAQSSLAFRGLPADARQTGSSLGARYLLAGTLRRAGDSIGFTPRLLDAATGSELWSRTYGRASNPSSMLAVQGEVASEVARVLELRFPPESGNDRAAPGAEAYEAYLEGRYRLRRFQAGVTGSREELVQSVGHFREAVSRSPDWAAAWAALGEALHWAATHGAGHGFDAETHFPESKAALERALALDPDHALAHASMGYVLHRWDLDFAGAEARFRRAFELDPDQYWHCGYALFLFWAERYEESVRALRRAEAQDPLFYMIKDFLGASYRCAGRFQEAIATTEAVLVANPRSAPARRDLVLALDGDGRTEDALARLDEAPSGHPYWELLRALLHARAGRRAEAEALLGGLDEESLAGEMLRRVGSGRVGSVPVHAATLVALSRPDAAIDVLEAAMDRDPWVLLYDRCYPELRALQRYPRYQELLRRTGLPEHLTMDGGPFAG